MDGYIKIYRSLTEDLLWQTSTPEQKVVLLTILMMVNHKEKEWEWKGKKFVCAPGQRVTSIEKIKALCGKGVSEQNIRTALVRFEKHGFLTTESTKTGRLITVANWAKYQGCEEQPNKQTNRQLTKTSQTPNKDLTTNKNDNNDKNERMKENNKQVWIDAGADTALIDTLVEFEKMRKAIKKTMTERARTMLLKELEKISKGDTELAIKILEQSILRCWQTVFPLKENADGKTQLERMWEELD